MKITWVNFLHFYQPPTADNETVILAVEKSYLRLISALGRNPKVKFTLNITGCLLERLEILGYNNLIEEIDKLRKRKQIELTGSAAYHPILPMLPPEEVIRNIKINEQILKKFFGKNFKAQGFFIPEAAYGVKAAQIIKKYGYKWIILDQIALGRKLDDFDLSKLYIDKNSGLRLCFRSRIFSKSYLPRTIFNLIKAGKDDLVISATDAELYGLHHGDFSGTFEKLLKRQEIKTLTISQYFKSLKRREAVNPLPSSWESTEKELQNKEPYYLWYNEKNRIQVLLWQLASLAIKTVNQYRNDENYNWSRQHLDRGLSSCTFWWASARDFKLLSAVSWNPDEIERGTNELIRSIRALTNPATRKVKIEAEKIYIKIKRLIWQKHWVYYWERNNR